MIKDPKIGQIVWLKEYWSENICSAKILTLGETEVSTEDSNKCLYAKIEFDVGISHYLLKDLYSSREELVEKIKKRTQNEINKIKLEIHDVNDLVRFMYNHCVASAEEYTDWNARQAVKEIAKEMLDLELE